MKEVIIMSIRSYAVEYLLCPPGPRYPSDGGHQPFGDKFDNLCFDHNGQKPADLPPRILKGTERFLPLAECLLRILGEHFTRRERDFLIAFVTAKGDRVQISGVMHIGLRTVDAYRIIIVRKLKRMTRYLVMIMNKVK
jgi:hypothetical protein